METRTCRRCHEEKPVGECFKNRWGYTNICKDCAYGRNGEKKERVKKKALIERIGELEKQLGENHKAQLCDFTPRQIFEHLKAMGYKWEKMTYTRIEEVSWDKI